MAQKTVGESLGKTTKEIHIGIESSEKQDLVIKKQTFDLFDLITENGRVSKLAFAFMLTLGVTSWIMIRLTLDGKMTEGYLGGYGALWIAPIIAKLFNTPTSTAIDTSITTSTKITP